jgi:hypothetical protein
MSTNTLSSTAKLGEYFTKLPACKSDGTNWVFFRDCFLFALDAAGLGDHFDWEQQLLSSFEVSPARDELQPAIILHHEFSQPSWPSRWQSASLLVGSNQLPVNSVTIISELNMVYINLILHAAAGSHLTQHIDHSYSVIAIFMPGHPFCREQPGGTKLQHVSLVLSNRWLKISVEFIS